ELNGRVEVPASKTYMHRRSNTEVSTGSALEENLGDWTNSLEDNLTRERLLGPPDSTTENLEIEIASPNRVSLTHFTNRLFNANFFF
ncbi:hypothetical protein, partial [Enterococcus faecium]|uniref:hypothetical protein n=1 Tax=Enterococcus faecium TaxID=1352 RepID=UPI003F428091